MPDQSNLLRNMQQVQSSLHSKVFNRTSGSNILFPHISYNNIYEAPGDAVGREAYMGATFAQSKLLSMKLTERGAGSGGSFMQKSFFGQRELAEALGAFTSSGHGASGLGDMVVSWDREMFQGLVRKGLSGSPGQRMTPIVPAKSLLHKYFPGISAAAASSKAEDIDAYVRGASSVQTGSGLDYLTRARKMILEEKFAAVGSGGAVNYGAPLSPNEVSQMVFYGSAMKAIEAGDNAPLGLQFFKQTLANHGVEGLSGTTTGVFNQADPYALARAIKSSSRNWSAYATSTGIGPAGFSAIKFGEFFDRIEAIAGRRYRDEFASIAQALDEQSGGKLALALDETGSAYMGMAGADMATFRPVPIGFAGKSFGIGASETGMTSGIYKLGGKVSSTMPTLTGQGVQSPVMMGLRAFYEGTQKVLGTTPENLTTALAAGHSNMRSAVLGGVGTLNDLSTPIITQGQRSIYGSLYDQQTIRESVNRLASVDAALKQVIDDVSANKIANVQMFHEGVKKAIQHLPAETQKKVSVQMTSVSRMAWPALKHEIKKGNILPTMLLEQSMFLPGELLTKRAQTKGFHQGRKIQEIWRPGVIQGIKAASARAGLHGAVGAVGVTSGVYRIDNAMKAAYAPGSMMTGALGGSGTPYSRVISPMAVIRGGGKTANLRLTGDAGAILTPLGRSGIGNNMAAAKQIEKFMTLGQTVEMLEGVAGKNLSMPAWQEYIAQVRDRGVRPGFVPAGAGLPIDPSAIDAYGLSQGTTHFLGATYSDYNAQRKLSFGRMAKRNHLSGLIAGSARYTAATHQDPASLYGDYGDLARHSYTIANRETVAGIDSFRMRFEHRSNLLTTLGGDLGANTQQFLGLYNEFGGTGLVARDGQLVTTKGFDRRSYLTASRKALSAMGFSSGEIGAHAAAMVGRMGGTGNFGSMSAEMVRRARLYLSTHSERFGAAEEIVSQNSPFSIKLQTLNQMAQSFGQKNPAFVLMRSAFERETGLRTTSNLSPSGFIDKASIPKAIKAPFMPLVHNEGFNSWAAMNGETVMSASDMAAKYGGEINLNAIKNKMPYDEIMGTAFMDPNRAGFYLDLGLDNVDLSLGNASVRAGHVYIPSGKAMRSAVRGAGGEGVTLGKESLEYGVFNLLSAASGSGDIREAALAVLGRQVAVGAKGGYLEKHAFSGRPEVAGRGRILPFFGKPGAGGTRIMNGRVLGSEYKVGISRSTMMQMFRNADGEMDQIGYDKAMKMMKERGYMPGMLMPTPTHGAGHINLVKFHLDKGLDDAGQLGYRMADFLASIMERDFDKDAIEAAMMAGAHWSKVAKDEYGSESAALRAFEEAFDNQRSRHTRMMQSYELKKKEWDSLFDSASPVNVNDPDFYKRASSLLTFGELPPVPWLSYYPRLGFTAGLVAKGDAEQIALAMTKEHGARLQKKFTAGDITAFRNAMQTSTLSPRQAWSETVLAFQSTAQSAIAKGGVYLDALGDYINTAPETLDLLRAGSITMEQAVERQVSAAQGFFGQLIDGESLGKLRTHSDIYAGKTAQQAAMLAGEITGRTEGAYLAAAAGHLKKDAAFRNPLREMRSDPLATIEFLTGEDISGHVMRRGKSVKPKVGDSAGNIEGVNNALKKGFQFLGEHWKGAAVIGGLAIGARAAYSMGDPGMEGPPVRMPRSAPAPLPPEPMIGLNAAGPSINSRPQEVRMSRSEGNFAMNSQSIRSNAVNINEMQVNANTAAFGTDIRRTIVSDSRRYSSNWEMHNAAEASLRGDFMHPYQS